MKRTRQSTAAAAVGRADRSSINPEPRTPPELRLHRRTKSSPVNHLAAGAGRADDGIDLSGGRNEVGAMVAIGVSEGTSSAAKAKAAAARALAAEVESGVGGGMDVEGSIEVSLLSCASSDGGSRNLSDLMDTARAPDDTIGDAACAALPTQDSTRVESADTAGEGEWLQVELRGLPSRSEPNTSVPTSVTKAAVNETSATAASATAVAATAVTNPKH